MCIKKVIAKEVRELFVIDYDVPVMVNCPCPDCNNVELSGPVVTLEEIDGAD